MTANLTSDDGHVGAAVSEDSLVDKSETEMTTGGALPFPKRFLGTKRDAQRQMMCLAREKRGPQDVQILFRCS